MEMAEVAAKEIYDHAVPGAAKCKSPGCPNWFKREGNRHRYCRGPGCTYKRGAPAEQPVREPQGAAEELLRRLQDEEGGEVGPAMLSQRRKAVQEAMRNQDPQALNGALIDEAAACVWWADRVDRREMPRQSAVVVPGAAMASQRNGVQPLGIVRAVLASHQRTAHLAEHRHNLLWRLLKAQEARLSAQHGVAQTAGSPQESDARVVLEQRHEEYSAAERAFEAAEAAWQERMAAMRELVTAGDAAPRLV